MLYLLQPTKTGKKSAKRYVKKLCLPSAFKTVSVLGPDGLRQSELFGNSAVTYGPIITNFMNFNEKIAKFTPIFSSLYVVVCPSVCNVRAP